jgi:hypothetical protein
MSPSGHGGGVGGKRGRCTLAAVVECLPEGDLAEAWRHWSPETGGTVPAPAAARKQLLEWGMDGAHALERLGSLGKRLAMLMDLLLEAPRYELLFADLAAHRSLEHLSTYDLEAAIATLTRRALVRDGESSHVATEGQRALAVPTDLGDALVRQRRSLRSGVFDAFTLRGHIDRLYDDPARARRTPPSRVREMYKMYSREEACVARIERLPEGLRELVIKVIMEFGGLLPRALFDRMETELPHWNGRRWQKILEDSLVGTVERLELGRFGIQHNDETLVIFNEVALAWLKRVAVPGDPDRPHDEAGMGVDLVSNLSRFQAYLLDHAVRFTVKGEIFKTTEKRILQDLIPNPGRELDRSEILHFMDAFSRRRGLIDSTGERTIAITSAGRDWEPMDLDSKLAGLLEHVVEESALGGEPYHQTRMRQLFMRLVRRSEPGVWYDLMYLPFVTRNQYLASLDEVAVEEWFSARTAAGGGATGAEDLQRMAWNLVNWVRKRLYLLGLVDLGYDAKGHPVAMKVTSVGARLFGMRAPEGAVPGSGSLIVTPDFEVVHFPSEDDAALVHDLDRFCEREKSETVRHFRISDRSVKRALHEGVALARMLEVLEHNSRTPVPQNVLYSIKDWAQQAGLCTLDEELVLTAPDDAFARRIASDPGVRPLMARRIDERTLQMKQARSAARLRSVLRELGWLVELV